VLLKAHKESQDAERAAARQLWHDEGWVFATPEGRPLNPFTALIEEARLPDRRLHDARHTAATIRKGVADQVGAHVRVGICCLEAERPRVV
jgi:hypothetical protein